MAYNISLKWWYLFKISSRSTIARYLKKIKPGNSSGEKLELIGLSSLFLINIIIF